MRMYGKVLLKVIEKDAEDYPICIALEIFDFEYEPFIAVQQHSLLPVQFSLFFLPAPASEIF